MDDYALRQTIRQLSPHWLPTLKEGHSRIDHPSHLAFILNEMRDVEAIAALKALLSATNYRSGDKTCHI